MNAVDLGGFRYTRAANPITALEQSDLVPGALQVVGRYQAINAGTDYDDVYLSFPGYPPQRASSIRTITPMIVPT